MRTTILVTATMSIVLLLAGGIIGFIINYPAIDYPRLIVLGVLILMCAGATIAYLVRSNPHK